MATCYIITENLPELGNRFTQVLHDLGVEVINYSETRTDGTIADVIRRSIRRADFVFAYFPHENPVRNLSFELGIAVGLSRPIFLLAANPQAVPVEFNGYVLATSLDDLDLLKFHLEAFLLNSVKPKGKPEKRPERIPDPSKGSRHFLEYTNKLVHASPPKPKIRSSKSVISELSNLSSMNAEHLVSQVFRNSEVNFRTMKSNEDFGMDFVLWNNLYPNLIGNAVGIEVKGRPLELLDQQKAVARLMDNLALANIHVGILTFPDSPEFSVTDLSRKLTVIGIDLVKFVQAVETDKLMPFVRQMVSESIKGLGHADI